MEAFRRAKEATLRALGAPIIRLGRPIGAADPGNTAGKRCTGSGITAGKMSTIDTAAGKGNTMDTPAGKLNTTSGSNSSSSSNNNCARNSSSNNNSNSGNSNSNNNSNNSNRRSGNTNTNANTNATSRSNRSRDSPSASSMPENRGLLVVKVQAHSRRVAVDNDGVARSKL